jgi:hypothetical protein
MRMRSYLKRPIPTFGSITEAELRVTMSSLPSVADHLSQQAMSRHADEADAFGRTAFNRYYYAAFLSTRSFLLQIERSWSRAPHGNIPDLLEVDLIKRLRVALKPLQTKGMVPTGRAKSLISQAGAAAGDMASILRTAYKVRIAADYEPETKVAFEPTTFRLATHTEAEAKQWLIRIDRNKGILLNVAKEVGLV